MPRKFDQEAKDRVVCLVAHSEAMDASPLDVRDALLSGCLRTLWQKTHGCVEKTTSCATPTSCCHVTVSNFCAITFACVAFSQFGDIRNGLRVQKLLM